MAYYKCGSVYVTQNSNVQIESAKGAIANLATPLAMPLVSLKTNIVAKGGGGQPSASVAITGFSEVNVTRAGKNLLAKPFIYNDNADLDSLSECFFIKKGSYIASFDSITNATNLRFIIRLKDANGNNLNTSDYITFNTGFQWSATRKAWINNANTTSKNCLFTLNQDCYIRILFGVGNTSSSSVASNAQLELGSTRTDYVPYNADTFTLSLGQTVYGGYVDWKEGSGVKTYSDEIDLGNLTWEAASGNRRSATITNAKIPSSTSVAANMLCSQFQAKSNDSTYGGTEGVSISASGKLLIYWADLIGLSNSQVKEKLTGVKLVYELAIPIEIDLPTTMPSTIEGEQNWFADSGDIELEYKKIV